MRKRDGFITNGLRSTSVQRQEGIKERVEWELSIVSAVYFKGRHMTVRNDIQSRRRAVTGRTTGHLTKSRRAPNLDLGLSPEGSSLKTCRLLSVLSSVWNNLSPTVTLLQLKSDLLLWTAGTTLPHAQPKLGNITIWLVLLILYSALFRVYRTWLLRISEVAYRLKNDWPRMTIIEEKIRDSTHQRGSIHYRKRETIHQGYVILIVITRPKPWTTIYRNVARQGSTNTTPRRLPFVGSIWQRLVWHDLCPAGADEKTCDKLWPTDSWLALPPQQSSPAPLRPATATAAIDVIHVIVTSYLTPATLPS